MKNYMCSSPHLQDKLVDFKLSTYKYVDMHWSEKCSEQNLKKKKKTIQYESYSRIYFP